MMSLAVLLSGSNFIVSWGPNSISDDQIGMMSLAFRYRAAIFASVADAMICSIGFANISIEPLIIVQQATSSMVK